MEDDADSDSDSFDTNYIWQQRIQRVLNNSDFSAQFPHASALGVEFNPTFPRAEKIPAGLLTNGAVLDVHRFAKAAKKATCRHLLDILHFNFDLGLESNSLEFAVELYTSVKLLAVQFRSRSKPVEEMQEVYVLPVVTAENTASELSSPMWTENVQLYDDRKGDPIFIKKGSGQAYTLGMHNYPLCKRLGVTFVLRPSNAPAQKLSKTLLTTGMVLEMQGFVEILGGRYCQLLKDLILHNFGEVYESCYLTRQVQALHVHKASLPAAAWKEYCEQPFEFVRKKRKIKKAADGEVDVIPEKRSSVVTHLSDDFLWEEKAAEEDASYMCPVECEDVDPEDAEVDVESVFPETKTGIQSSEEETKHPPNYHGSHKRRLRKTVPALQISAIFSDDTLPMHQKSVKQKEWALRTNRIREILGKETRSNFMFCRSRKIGFDFNVGSGRAKRLDPRLLTNHTLYEVQKFCSHLSRSLINYLLNMIELNFDFASHENFQSYLYGKEKGLSSQPRTEELLNTPIQFPDLYCKLEVDREEYRSDPSGDDSTGEDISDEFPYCKRIGVNLWSTKGRGPGKKLNLNVLTCGALLEIFGLARHLCNKPPELMHDVLEHNFDLDLQDSTADEADGLRRWLNVNRSIIKKPFCAIKTNMWLNEVVHLKPHGTTSDARSHSKAASPLPRPPSKECTYEKCKEIGLDLNLSGKSATKQKLDLKLLTRGALFEVHRFVEAKCNRYVPALYEILEHNFDLSSQRHRRVEFAWSMAAQTLAMVRKGRRGGQYMGRVFELPLELEEGEICKREEDERRIETTEEEGGDEVVFVQKLVPVDIDVEIQ